MFFLCLFPLLLPLLSTFLVPSRYLQSSSPFLHIGNRPILAHPDSILLLAGSHLSCRLSIASSSSSSCSHPTSLSPTYPRTPGTCCFKGHPCQSTFEWVLPMAGCLLSHSPHTLQLLLLVSAPPIPSCTFPPTLFF